MARPGDVIRVVVSGTRDQSIHATAFGTDLRFDYDDHRKQWIALLGVDLETKPGTYRVRFTHDDGKVVRSLRIVRRAFRVRRLKVASEFVEPPQSALDQIALDNRKLGDAYARVSPRRWDGPFLAPVDGAATSNFGTRSYFNGQPRAPHAGIDFSGDVGQPVRASNHGTVAIAEPMYFTGNTVVVDHGSSIVSVFAHLSEFRVSAGETVTPTTVIGLVGATGRVTAPHLHWSVRMNGARIDPMSLIASTRN